MVGHDKHNRRILRDNLPCDLVVVANRHGGFYTQDEYDLAPLIARHPERNFLELGRSCVLKPFRTKATIELLWHGVWGYIREHKFDAMVGCASLEGTDPDKLALPLSFLHHHASAPPEWTVRAHPHRHVEMNRLAKEDIATDLIFQKAGILSFRDEGELIQAAAAFATQPIPKGNRVGIITNTGGPAVIATDVMVARGLTLPPLSEKTQTILTEALFPEASVNNPVDVWPPVRPNISGPVWMP